MLELETTLLCENLVDAFFYRKITEHFMNCTPNYSNLLVVFQEFCGGGSTIGSCYQHFMDSESSFCLAITDNDLKYEGYIPKNSTTSDTITNKDKTNPYNCTHHIIGVRDIENLIPFEWIDIVLPSNEIKTYRDPSRDDYIIKYFDYKEGLHSNKNGEIDEDIKRFWEEKMGVNFDNYEENGLKKIYIKGLGGNFLNNIINKLNDNTIKFENYSNFHEIIRTEMEYIGELIFSRCCAIKYSNL